jgi:DNA-directed RNA polymerase subunit F
MSFVATNPEMVSAAADNLQSIGSVMNEQNDIVTGRIAEITPAAADEVSALTAIQFSAHAVQYQAVSAQAAVVRELLVTTLQAAADCYAATETANAAWVS